MKVEASILNSRAGHEATVSTNGHGRRLDIPAREAGQGSSVNGGELLLLALATCYCNDIYREAARRGMAVESVAVVAEAEFATEGQPATGVRYRARVAARGSQADIRDLLEHTDRVAEIQNTLRAAVPVQFLAAEPVVVG